MGEVIKQVRNIFIDSETNTNIDSTQVSVNLIPNDFNCGPNEAMRMTLTTLEMRNNWYNINQYNNTFYIFTPTALGSATGTYYQIQMAASSYLDFVDGLYNTNFISTTTNVPGLNSALTTALNAGGIGTGHVSTFNILTRKFTITLNVSGAGSNATLTNNSYPVSFAIPPNLGSSPIGVSPLYSFVDTAEIIGGYSTVVVPVAGSPPRSLMSGGTVSGATLIFVSPFVAQLNSMEAIYLRANLQSLNYSTYGFAQNVFQNSITGTQIFARIPLPTQHYYLTNPFTVLEDKNDLFTIEIGNKQLDNITLYMTDDKNRPIPMVAVGQVIAGMLSFKCSLKWEVIAKDMPSPFIPTVADLTHQLYAMPRQP